MSFNFFKPAPKPEEALQSQEGAPVVDTKVVLEFFRHGNKEKMAGPDEHVILSEKGRVQAMEKGKEISPQPEVSLAFGSPRIRTQDTAYRIMLSGEDITPDMSLEDIKSRVSDELGGDHVKKMIQDDRLNFALVGETDKEGVKAYGEGRYLDWMIKDSDAVAKKYQDLTSAVFTRQAAGIAELCKRYIVAGGNFNRLVATTNKYEQFGNQLERYLGTHQGVVESFVAKVVTETQGLEERDRFLAAAGVVGFAETQGIKVEINNHGQEQTITFTYPVKEGEVASNHTVTFGVDVLDKIIADREAFDADIKKHEEK